MVHVKKNCLCDHSFSLVLESSDDLLFLVKYKLVCAENGGAVQFLENISFSHGPPKKVITKSGGKIKQKKRCNF